MTFKKSQTDRLNGEVRDNQARIEIIDFCGELMFLCYNAVPFLSLSTAAEIPLLIPKMI